MSKNNQSKRKAKRTASRAKSARMAQNHAEYVAEALMDVCEPFEAEFFKSLDLEGKIISPNDLYELWHMGAIAWNMAINGYNDANEFIIIFWFI